MVIPSSVRRAVVLSLAPLSLAIVCPRASAYDQSFDYTSFETGFQQAHFNVLNYASINGNYMMTSTDNHRPEMVANNNALAEFYNNWLADYNKTPKPTAAQEADAINTYTINNSARNGPRPTWLVLNELSSSLWSANPGPSNLSTYRTWVMDCVRRLRDVHGYNVVALAPFQNPGANDASWQELSAMAHVGAEIYLSGTEVWNSGADNTARLNWARSQYQSSKNSYLNRGVPADKLFIIEHFANNNATYVDNQGVTHTTGWGRAGLASAADWDTVIQLRQDAIRNVGFPGFLAYNWGGNAMGVTQAEQLQHEYYYRSKLVLAGQQPQWLSDSAINVNGIVIPLSWGEFLNWKGGVPDVPGAVANFYRTNTASRTVTLDGNRTVGTLSFNSPATYSISAGGGGGATLTLNNGGVGAGSSVTVMQGSHGVTAAVVMVDNATFNIAGSLALGGGLSNPSGRKLTKTGGGTLTISGAQAHGAGAVFDALAGTTSFSSDGGSNLTVNAGAPVDFNSSQRLAGLTIAPAIDVQLALGGARTLSVAAFTNTGGTLDLHDNDMIVRNGGGAKRAMIDNQVATAYAFGAWTGPGITSSRAATTDGVTTLGVALAGDVFGISDAQTTTWNAQTVSGSDVLVMYTYAGDVNLDGLVDGADYGTLDNWIQFPGTSGYANGDVNYDGVIDGADYGVLDNSIQLQGPLLSTSGSGASAKPGASAPGSGAGADFAVAVPEPSSASVVTVTLLTVASVYRRRRKH